ncbi:hypothetical protein QQ045_008524 [Rhodiola kirilowii]
MRKHGWQLHQYIAYGLYTPLITCAFSLYVWCAAADPADPGVFRSKKYLHIALDAKPHRSKDSKHGEDKDIATSNACSTALLAVVPCAAFCNCWSANDESVMMVLRLLWLGDES